MNKWIIIGVFSILLILGISLGYIGFNKPVQPDNTDIISFDNSIGLDDGGGFGTGEDSIIQEAPNSYTVEITSSGFSPNSLTINAGDTVVFVNQDSRSGWPASVIHPTHTVYPNSNINKCGTNEEIDIFDSCRGLEEGESYSFTFNEVGTWGYHNHLISSKKGTIIVN